MRVSSAITGLIFAAISCAAQSVRAESLPSYSEVVFMSTHPGSKEAITYVHDTAYAKTAVFSKDVLNSRPDLKNYLLFPDGFNYGQVELPANNGDVTDAFRHIYGAALLTYKLGVDNAYEYLLLHEGISSADATYIAGLDQLSKMDLHNNEIGIVMARQINELIATGKLKPADVENRLHGMVYDFLFVGSDFIEKNMKGKHQATGMPRNRPVILVMSNQTKGYGMAYSIGSFYQLQPADLAAPTGTEQARRLFTCAISWTKAMAQQQPFVVSSTTSPGKPTMYYATFKPWGKTGANYYLLTRGNEFFAGTATEIANSYHPSDLSFAKQKYCFLK